MNNPVYFIDPDGMSSSANESNDFDHLGRARHDRYGMFIPMGERGPDNATAADLREFFEIVNLGRQGGSEGASKTDVTNTNEQATTAENTSTQAESENVANNGTVCDVDENTDPKPVTYAASIILTGNKANIEAYVNVEYKYSIDKNGNVNVIENTIKVNTAINDWVSPVDKYYENKVFSLTVNPKVVVRGNYLVFEAKGTFVYGNVKIKGIGFEVNPVVQTFTGVIDMKNPSKSFANYNSKGKNVGRLYQ